MSDSVRPHRWQPTRPHRPWYSPGKNTGVGCHFLLQCMKVKSESEVAQSCPSGVPWPSPKESWVPKNWCFWTVLLEKTLESPLDCKEIQPVHPKGNQSWIFIGRTDTEAETSTLWPPDEKKWLIGRNPDAGRDWRWEEKGTTEDEMVGWHHWCDGHEFE